MAATIVGGAVGEFIIGQGASGAVQGAKLFAPTPIGVVGSLLVYSPGLNVGEDERMMDMHRKYEESQSKARSQTRDQASSTNCDSTADSRCKDRKRKGSHSGRIQVQEGTNNIGNIKASESGSAWTDEKSPPTLGQCYMYVDRCYGALEQFTNNKKMLKGAIKARENMKAWMKNKPPYGVSAKLLKSFYFNGDVGRDNEAYKELKKEDSRRMDVDVLKGEILRS